MSKARGIPIGHALMVLVLAAIAVGCAAPASTPTAAPQAETSKQPTPAPIPDRRDPPPSPRTPDAPAPSTDAAVAAEAHKQSVLALRQQIDEQARLHALFWPLNRAAAPLCASRAVATLGPAPRSLRTMNETTQRVAREVLDIDDRPTFTEVVTDTPAARAGVQPGDRLLSIDGVAVAAGAEGLRAYAMALQGALARRSTVSLRLQRAGREEAVIARPEPVCASGIAPIAGDAVNAYVSGRSVLISRGMLRFANDDDLGIVIAHEIAHIALGHAPPAARPQGSTSQGGAAQGAASGQASASAQSNAPAQARAVQNEPADPAARRQAQLRELDADVVGMHLAAAAGLPVSHAPDFWRRMAANNPATIQGSHLRTHPASAERFVALDRALEALRTAPEGLTGSGARLRDGSLTEVPARLRPGGPSQVRVARIP